ncbi:MAG: PBP1A family penicillin-binding protein [Anaerolineae bacterium]|nr:MAG: PBP1A family penicillin-binding protein [Anaerolineae bacterium]
MIGLVAWGWLTADLPRSGDLPRHVAAPSTQILDRHGRLLYEVIDPARGRHEPVGLERIPRYLLQATVATEDANFYRHAGLDLRAILRALWINLRGGEVLSGGSTITQQLARNLLLSPEERAQRTLTRKLRESILAWRLARAYSRDEVLALYLNETYYGNYAYGVEAAAQAYFGKHVGELDLAECALLAGLPQAPSAYTPLNDLAAARQRQRVVLGLMVKQGFISQQDVDLAADEPLHFASTPFPVEAPHFVMYVRGLLEASLGRDRLEQGGLRVYTTLDLALQETAGRIARRHLARLADKRYGDRDRNVHNTALVALDPHTGEILAMLGSPDYFDAEIDGAVNVALALRQPGSAIKPITYAAAFDPVQAASRGEVPYTPATMIADVRATFLTRENRPYTPRNYNGVYRGPVLARQALASSLNVPAVKVLDQIGLETMIRQARRMGITTFDTADRFGLALTLGGGEVRLLDLTAAYAALANGGYRIEPVAIRRVEDAGGGVLLALHGGRRGPALDGRVAYLVTDVLADDWARMTAFGEGSVLRLDRPAAVKTGTTSDWRDNWTVGYTPDLVVGVWAGNADNSPMRGVSGISGAAPVWRDFMRAALKGRPVRAFTRPDGLVEAEVCALSGLRAGPHCPHHRQELFIAGTAPQEACDWHRAFHIDIATGLLAGPDTPLNRVVERVYTLLPPELADWGRSHGIELPPKVVFPGLPSGDQVADRVVLAPVSAALPTLALISPDPWTVYRVSPRLPTGEQRIIVQAQPGKGVSLAEVTLLADGRPLATERRQPYRALWALTAGEHTFQAVGRDASGQQVASEIVVVTVME